jgi:hypothetical protein
MLFNEIAKKSSSLLSKSMIGGKMDKLESVNLGTDFLTTLISLLIRSLIVWLGYNSLMPKFILTLNNKEYINNFRELTYGESIILVVVFQSLIG